MTIHRDAFQTILKLWLILGAIAFVVFWFIPNPYIAYPIVALLVAFMLFIVFFFRVPTRNAALGDGAITSVADGEVVVIEKVFESEHLNRECIQVSVYMSFFNVHVNFWPISGEVTYYKYHPGKFLLAFLPKASELNEHTTIGIRNERGEILFKQLAGTFARRIVCYAKVGDERVKGEQCGLIKFGSRIDMYIPLDADIKVKIGEKVKACETVIAELDK